jgi:glucose/arabinose dehydrogenase
MECKDRKLETTSPPEFAFMRSRSIQLRLFVTDQEGETWMPNGNPLDELNYIIPGRNYGFPPRHEKWLPNLVSEPPVVAFGPQHQSSCGFVFNEPEARTKNSPGRRLFGPKWWEGDAIVAGESRGKIWRVRLVKTPHGYVGKETIIARLSMLATDVAISPKGALYVSCHSGPPDWGTGPQGEGKLFKILSDPSAPQPVIMVRVKRRFGLLDKPLDSSVTNGLIGREVEFRICPCR